MAVWSVEVVGLAEAKGAVKGVSDRAGGRKSARPVMKFIGEEMLARTQARMRRGLDVEGRPFKRSRRAASEGGQTLWERGALAASANYTARDDGVDLYSSDRRARVHFLGLEIRPKAGKKYLTIPLRAAGGAGARRDRTVSPLANRTGARASHYSKKSTFVREVRGKLFIFQKLGDGKIRALFLLVRRSKQVERKWLGFGAGDLEMASQAWGRWVADGSVGL